MERVLSGRGGHVPSVPILSPSDLKTLHQVFDSCGYDRELSQQNSEGLEVLTSLFARGLSVELEQARRTFHPLDLDRLIASGLLYEEKDELKARFQAQRYGGLIFFSDFFRWETDKGFVLSIGPAGNYLARLTIRRQVESTLDLGCGCGIQSLLAARHSDKVTATDINPRALALTRLNAELNDIHNIETRQGSYFEPVNGQRFDLIVANLPYVITPEKRLIYRNVDQPGDAGTHKRIKEIPAYLKEGGFAQILINWIHGKSQEPSEPICKTIANQGVDAWLIQNGSKQPDEYAGMWLKQQTQSDLRKFKKTKQDWLRWYQNNHIERIALGAITLRRRSNGPNWFCSAEVNRTLEDQAAEQFLRLFAAQDYLTEIDDKNSLLNKIFTPLNLGFTGDENQPIAYANHGSRFEIKIHPTSKAILQKLAEINSLEKVIRDFSQQSGFMTKEIQDDVLADIWKLLKLGMVVPSDARQNIK
ncbi:MAG: class I SAM-dependent methyltransferase [Chloroflexi bacterium]|nr:class I SAM-dependent methyltransferase [Chloroflexota bacterium]